MKTYPVPADLLQAVLDYFATRPWREVNGFMVAFEKVAKSAEAGEKAAGGPGQ